MFRLALIALASFSSVSAGTETLPDFSNPATLRQVQAKGSKLSLVSGALGPAIRVEAGLEHKWPGPTFAYPAGLDLSKHGELVVPLRNPGKDPLRIHLRIDSRPKNAPPKSKALDNTWPLDLAGGQSGELRIPLIPHFSHPGIKRDDFFGMRGIPWFNRKSMHLGNITALIFFVTNLEKPVVYEIGNPRLEGTPNPGEPIPEKPFPLIDGFGQFKHRDWPGKTRSVEEMRKRRDEEAKLLAALSPPASWNRFGGWKNGPQLEATGWFRTARHDDKWHLVDPEGRLFFSLGIDCIGYSNHTVLDDRRHWFESLPPDDNAHAPFYGSGTSHMPNYHFYNRRFRTFNHHKYNVMRKYGGDYERAFAETSAARLPVWGVNTIANWSKSFVYSLGKVPYVVSINTQAPPIEGSSGYWGKFVDPFHPDFQQKLRQRLKWKQIAATRDDPMCIGYFIDNELSWGDETSLATATLASPAGQHAKLAFIAGLKTEYRTIAALNQAWQTKHPSWDALLASTEPPKVAHARPDLEAFYDRIADTYFRSIREILKEFAPHHLYLGCRFAWGNKIATTAAARHCDVFSFNAYTRHLATKRPFMEEAGDMPCIIGEFHFGALDRGMFHTGLIPVADQDERARAFTAYVSDCLAHPNIVGCHWFQYTDSPTTGRSFDGENYQIGFTDVCDTPYPELIKASRAIGEQLYEKR